MNRRWWLSHELIMSYRQLFLKTFFFIHSRLSIILSTFFDMQKSCRLDSCGAFGFQRGPWLEPRARRSAYPSVFHLTLVMKNRKLKSVIDSVNWSIDDLWILIVEFIVSLSFLSQITDNFLPSKFAIILFSNILICLCFFNFFVDFEFLLIFAKWERVFIS